MLCAVPALRALRRAAPQAHVALVSLPWAREFAARFDGYIDEFIEFPGFPGLPEQQANGERAKLFFREMREREFDLAIQLHGNGTTSNRVCAGLGAKYQAGYYDARQICPDATTFMAYPIAEHEVRRHLQLMQFLGARPRGEQLEFTTNEGDNFQLQTIAPSLDIPSGNYVCLHPGGKLATRRWPTEQFAYVANKLADYGLYPVLTGTAPELPLVQQVCDLIPGPHLNLCSQTDLGMLAALLKSARVVVTNDTGVSHLAAAVGTPSVVIFLGSDQARWSPLDRSRHVVISAPVACQPCEYELCPIGFVCAERIDPDTVTRAALHLSRDPSISNRGVGRDTKRFAFDKVCQLHSS
jgi:ADP-heptose:LPS heptosyltransferase